MAKALPLPAGADLYPSSHRLCWALQGTVWLRERGQAAQELPRCQPWKTPSAGNRGEAPAKGHSLCKQLSVSHRFSKTSQCPTGPGRVSLTGPQGRKRPPHSPGSLGLNPRARRHRALQPPGCKGPQPRAGESTLHPPSPSLEPRPRTCTAHPRAQPRPPRGSRRPPRSPHYRPHPTRHTPRRSGPPGCELRPALGLTHASTNRRVDARPARPLIGGKLQPGGWAGLRHVMGSRVRGRRRLVGLLARPVGGVCCGARGAAWSCVELRGIALNCTALHSSALHCIAWHGTARHRAAQHCMTLCYLALHGIARHRPCSARLCTGPLLHSATAARECAQ